MAFNELSDEQAERLALLLEELGESQKAIGKILRHGYNSHNPDHGNEYKTNQIELEIELGDVMCAVDLLCESGDLSRTTINLRQKAKRKKVKPYLHHAVVPDLES